MLLSPCPGVLEAQVIKDAIRYDGQSCTDKDVTSGDCDSFVYSLVAYYLIKDNQDKDAIWSGAARIGRFQIKDGVQNPNIPLITMAILDTLKVMNLIRVLSYLI